METNVRQAASSSSTSTSQQNTHEETSTLAGSPPAYSHIIDFAPLPPTHSIQIIDSEFLVQQVTSVGISEEWARIALRRCSGNVDDAIRLCIDCGALENETPPTQSATSSRTGKKKGNILSRTLGKPFKRSAEKSERTVIQEEKIERDLPPELPPSYDVVVPAPPPTELSIEDEPPDLPSYEEIFSEPSAASPQKVSTEIDSNESKLPPANHLPVPPPPRVSANSMTSPEESALDYSTCEVSSNAENSSVPQTSLPDTQPSFSSAPPLLSQSQKSWRGWKHSDSSGEISPVYAPVSRDFTVDCSVDLTVTDMRKIDQSQSDDQHVDEDLDSPPEYEENVVLTEISQHTPRLESGHSAEETVRSSEDNEASESEPIPLISNTRSTSGPIVLTFDDVVSSDDESVQTEEISPDPYLHGRSSLRMQSSLETLIDRGEESPVQVTSRLELTSDINIPGEIPPTSTIRQDVSDFTQITSPRSHVPENLVVEAVTPPDSSPTEIPQSRTSDTLPHEDDTRPRGRFQTRSNSHAYTLPTHLPSHSTDITSSLPPRPTSISRLPRATAVIDDDNMDDDTIHGEAYVQVSMSSVGVGTAVADLYMRDESGGLYMAVAAPLTGVEDDDLPTPFQAPPTIGEGDQPRGMFSYARNRLYGQQRNTRRDIAGGVRRRVFLPFDIEERDGKFFPVLYLTQPKLGANNGPQYNRPAMLRMTPSSSRTLSVRHAEVNTPPLWDGGSDPKECSICLHTAGILYKIHHCRNCGHYVCNNCSKKDWLASMLPKTYVPEKESVIRVCDNCSYLQEGFVDALRAGDLNRSMVFYLTGNVNVHCPMTIYKSEEYPIHTAVQGGNIHLVRWLVEDRRCSLRDGDAEPLKTSEGLSPLAIAAFYGHRDIMEYLVREQGSHVTEIKDTSILLRGLHAALEAPGDLPAVEAHSSLGSLFGRRALPRELEPIDSESATVSAPVSAQLATGNRNISRIPVTVAEAAPAYSVSQATSRPKLATGKRRSIVGPSLLQTRRTLEESSRIMQATTPHTEAETNSRTPVVDVSEIQRAITTPYTDDDVSVMTPDMMSQFRGYSARASVSNNSPERNHRRSRSLHSSATTALAVSSMSPSSSTDSLERSINIRSQNSETPRNVSRYEVNSANFGHQSAGVSADDDDQSVDTLMTANNHMIDPIEANRMSIRATSQSFARLEAEEREAQRILSQAASFSRSQRR